MTGPAQCVAGMSLLRLLLTELVCLHLLLVAYAGTLTVLPKIQIKPLQKMVHGWYVSNSLLRTLSAKQMYSSVCMGGGRELLVALPFLICALAQQGTRLSPISSSNFPFLFSFYFYYSWISLKLNVKALLQYCVCADPQCGPCTTHSLRYLDNKNLSGKKKSNTGNCFGEADASHELFCKAFYRTLS